MTDRLATLETGLLTDVMARGLGHIYSTDELLALAGPGWCIQDLVQAVAQRGVMVQFQGGNSRVRVQPGTKRKAFLHRIDDHLYCWDAEAGVQSGLEAWLKHKGYLVRAEFPDRAPLWQQMAEHPEGLAGLPIPGPNDKAPTACRDLVAHRPDAVTTSLEIWEVKGKTALDADLYETFGQLFPVADGTVTKGWTINKVPKHGNGLKYARLLLETWGAKATVHIAVAIPDFPPPGWEIDRFYKGPSAYYPRQVSQFEQFAKDWATPETDTFSRLLSHLRDEFDVQQMMQQGVKSVGFRFLGYQGRFIRDFASNLPLDLAAPAQTLR